MKKLYDFSGAFGTENGSGQYSVILQSPVPSDSKKVMDGCADAVINPRTASRVTGRFVQDPLAAFIHLAPNGLYNWGSIATRSIDMKPRIKVLTLGVRDLEKSLAFYRDGLGLPTEGIIGEEFEDGAVAFFNFNDDLLFALYPTASLAKDAKIAPTESRLGAISIGHTVASKQEVDAVMAQAEAAGAHVTDPAHDRFWGGYSGYFHDPDGHLWEIAWNPAWEVKE
jgi:uncharacterized protein